MFEEIDLLHGDLVAVDSRATKLATTLDRRLTELAARVDEHGASGSSSESVTALSEDLRLLRDALRFELSAVDVEIGRLHDALESVSEVPTTEPGGPPDEEAEPRWVVLTGDPDPGVRFSALTLLGRRRSDRSVQASRDALSDTEPMVLWIALRNLGAFRERAAAADIAAHLDHPAAVVRAAAYDSVLRLGGPPDTGFDPVVEDAARAVATRALRAWADELE